MIHWSPSNNDHMIMKTAQSPLAVKMCQLRFVASINRPEIEFIYWEFDTLFCWISVGHFSRFSLTKSPTRRKLIEVWASVVGCSKTMFNWKSRPVNEIVDRHKAWEPIYSRKWNRILDLLFLQNLIFICFFFCSSSKIFRCA